MEKAHSAGAEISYLPSSLSVTFAKNYMTQSENYKRAVEQPRRKFYAFIINFD